MNHPNQQGEMMPPAKSDPKEPTQTAGGVDVMESDQPDDAGTTQSDLQTNSAVDEQADVTAAPVEDEALQRQIHGSGWPQAQEETLAATLERVGEDAYYRSPMDYWTAQQGPLPQTGQVAALGPQVYAEEQLPDPNVARAAGIPPQQIPSYLVAGSLEDAVSHPRGPEPGELVRFAVNRANSERMLADAGEHPDQQDHFVSTSSGLANVRAAQEQAESTQQAPDGGDSGTEQDPAVPVTPNGEPEQQ